MKKTKTTPKLPTRLSGDPFIFLRPYQHELLYHPAGILVLHWSRQIGKSFFLASWAVDRALNNPGRLITVLSNSRANGAEFLEKCHEVCVLLEKTLLALHAEVETVDLSPDFFPANLRLEIRFKLRGDDKIVRTSRIKVLAANPRTARGFSGDLILDEFAFHENSAAIWEAAEPILAANKDYACRVASTGNGKHNFFYRLAHGKCGAGSAECGMGKKASVAGESVPLIPAFSPNGGEGARRADEGPRLFQSVSGFTVSRVTRTQAYALGVKIFDPATRNEITPEQARDLALDKRAYDQNYECAFADENLTLLSHELINAAECDGIGEISEQDWTASQLRLLEQAVGPLYVGFDVARRADLSVISVVEKVGHQHLVRAILRIRDMRLPDQQERLGRICRLSRFQCATIDMTGLGLGLYEYAQKEFGAGRIHGINFASTVPATRVIRQEGRAQPTVRVTEALALELLQCYEDRRIQHPADARLRDDLRKPERVTTPGGRVSIAATRDEAGHADHFWSLALALEASATGNTTFAYEAIQWRRNRMGGL